VAQSLSPSSRVTVTSTRLCKYNGNLPFPNVLNILLTDRHIGSMVGLKHPSIDRDSRLTRTLSLGNEHEVGQGIKDSGVPREQIFLTSKLWNTHHPNVNEGLQKSLDALGTDYLDLYVSCKLALISADRSSLSLMHARLTHQ
jgi:hypothetical protein